jgi:hypothetical protein
MVQNIKKLSDFLNIEFQKDSFDKDVTAVLKIIKDEAGIELKNEELFIKKNIVKVKTTSNIRFVVLLNLDRINARLKNLDKGFSLEL